MTLGWYCGDDPFGPYDHPLHDLTHCFQSLVILFPPSAFMIMAFLYRYSKIRHLDSTSLLIDPLPRFPQIISVFLALLPLFFLLFFILQGHIHLYEILQPSLSFLAWSLSLLLLRFEHSRGLPLSPLPRIFYLLSFIASAKQAESSVLSFVFGTAAVAFDILIFLHLFLACFMLRYAITGIGQQQGTAQWGDVEEGLVEEVEEETPAADKSMWKRFLNFNGDVDEGGINVDHSLNAHNGGGVRSSLDVREDKNPFASNPFEERAEEGQNPFLQEAGPAYNPFAAPPPPPAPSASKVKALTASLLESHPLSGSTLSLPSFEDATVGGRTIIQFQLVIHLTQPAIISGDEDVDVCQVWKRYREFEGLHASLLNTARKYGLTVSELPPAPKRKRMEEGRRALEVWLQGVMEQPLYWDDVAEFAGLLDRITQIAQYKLQLQQQREQDRKDKMAAAKQADEKAADAKRREKEGSRGPAQVNGIMQVKKVTVERAEGLDYKYQIISVSVSGWSRWMDGGLREEKEGQEEEEDQDKKKKSSNRSALTTPIISSGASRRKGGSANPSLSSSAFYLTLDLPIKTTVGDYTVYHTLSEISDFRASLTRHFTSTQPSLVPSLPSLHIGRPSEEDTDAMAETARAVEVFFQSLISVPAFQCNVLYAFLERRKPKDQGGEAKPLHLVSGQKPLASYSIAQGQWKTIGSAPGGVTSPNVSVPTSPVGGKRRGRVGKERKEEPINAPLFPEAVKPMTPSSPSSLSSHSPSSDSSFASSLTSSSPLGVAASNNPSAETSHRFAVSIPSFSLSNPADPKSHVLYSITVREYFSLSSFIEWHITRRYRDFEAMHLALSKSFAGYAFPPLPAKKRKVGKRKEGELEERRSQLETYIQQIINVRMFQVDEFFSFFDMNNPNREFSVGTQVKGPEAPTGGLEGVREAERGEGEDDVSTGRVVNGGGMRGGARNGSPAPQRERRSGGEESGRRSRGNRAPVQVQQPQTTNPFDM